MKNFKQFIIFCFFITLPSSIFFLVLVKNTYHTYYQHEQYTLASPKGTRLYRIGMAEYHDLKRVVFSALGYDFSSNVSLVLNDTSISKLNKNLPLSGTEYQDKSLAIINETPLIGKIKYRGDNFYHWGFPQKSWRFKTSKKNIHNGINKFNFIIPKGNEMLNNHLAYNLAKKFNLLAPDSELTELTVNGVYRGPRIKVEQIDESFLRKNRRMPNDIYRGDNVGQKSIKGVKVSLFKNPSIWEKASYNNHYDEDSMKPLESLVSDIKDNNYTLYDLESFASFGAFIDLIGAYHFDTQHNWILYYDSYYERMYPIIWDPVGWWQGWVGQDHVNIITSELLDSLYFNFDYIRTKNTVLRNFFVSKENQFYKYMADAVNTVKNIIDKNGFTFSMGRNYKDKESSLDAIDLFVTSVQKRLDKIKQYSFGQINPENYSYTLVNNTIRLSISGSKMISSINLQLRERQLLEAFDVEYKQGNKIHSENIINSISQEKSSVKIDLKLLANTKVESSYKNRTKITYHEATYDFKFEGINSENIESVSLSFDNLSQETTKITRVDKIEQKAFDIRLTNIIPASKILRTLTWSGEKYFSGFNLIEDNIIIKPGTKLNFDEGATLKVLGKVTAVGTVEQPIRFDAMDSSKPWGAFALKDKAANGSVFKHVTFKNGSGDKGDLYEYTAMFSVHNVQKLLVEDSEFYDSKITDDMVHIIYSDVKFKNTKFIRSLSDALDIDISNAVIENCEFINSGNDSIDLMTSDAVVINTIFKNSKDKGISIGEGSNLLAINNLIENSLIGMQSKDTSLAYIYNTTFIGNDKAIDAYHKNWRYSEGGIIYVDKCNMQRNIENATVGKKSKVIINDCQIDTKNNFDAKDLRKGNIIVSDIDFIEATFEQEFFQNHSNLIQKHTQGYYE